MLRVVFICSGNICRSPMAQAIFEHEARAQNIPHIALSMGTLGLLSQSAPPEAVAACAEIGIDLSYHRSQPISSAVLQRATQIFIMEDGHRQHLQNLGIFGDRVRFLGALDPLDPRPEIDDPVDQSLPVFQESRDRIQRAVRAFLALAPR